MNRAAIEVLAGLLFGVGLLLSGMTNPGTVLAFLDVTGAWDPSLALVMVGAIGVHGTYWLGFGQDGPRRPADRRVVLGSALFGIGWGLGGYCPGPAVVALGGASGQALAFVLAMLAGMAAHRRWAPETSVVCGDDAD